MGRNNVVVVFVAPMMRDLEVEMNEMDIMGYEPLLDEIKELIHKKQFEVIRIINAETVNIY